MSMVDRVQFIRQKYGETAAQLVSCYMASPEIIPRTIAEVAGVSSQQVRRWLHELYGTSRQPRLTKRCSLGARENRFAPIINSHLPGCKKELGTLIFSHDGIRFAVRQLGQKVVENTRYFVYKVFPKFSVQYVVGIFDNKAFIIKHRPGKGHFGFVHIIPEELEGLENAFHLLGRLDGHH